MKENLNVYLMDDTEIEVVTGIVMNMYRKGYTLEQIADVTKKSISEIRKIIMKEPSIA